MSARRSVGAPILLAALLGAVASSLWLLLGLPPSVASAVGAGAGAGAAAVHGARRRS